MECVNLKKVFGKKYHVRYEESYYAEHGENARVEDPWLMFIPCRNGHICPWGSRDLAASTSRPGPVANALKELTFATIAQEGSDGITVLFDAEHIDEVARTMKPRRRRRLSPEERARRVKRLQEYWADKGQVRTLTEAKDTRATGHPTSESSRSVSGSELAV